MTESNALHSLYGGKAARKALSGMVGGQAREQTVLTPRWLLDGIIGAVSMPIALDPCTTPENPTGASVHVTEAMGVGGLGANWHLLSDGGLTYVNPPYDSLETWLGKCCLEGSLGTPIVALIPWRSQRTWFMEAAQTASWVSTLAPFAFVGHKQAFPAPLCLMGWNVPAVHSLIMPTKRGTKEVVTALFNV